MQSKYALRCLPLDPYIAVWGLITTASQIRNVKVVAWKTNTNLKLVKNFKELRFLSSSLDILQKMYRKECTISGRITIWHESEMCLGSCWYFRTAFKTVVLVSGHQLSKDCGLSCCTSCSVQDGLSITGGNTAGPQRTVSTRDLFSKFEMNRSRTILVMQYL